MGKKTRTAKGAKGRVEPARPRGRPPRPADDYLGTQIGVRLPPDAAKKLDAYIEDCHRREPGVPWSRALAIRSIVMKFLADLETDSSARRRG